MADQTGYNLYFDGHWKSVTQGNNGEVLTLSGGVPAWAAPSAAVHNLLSATHSDVVAGSPVAGDLLYANGTPKWTKLAIGNAQEVLQVSGGAPIWGGLVSAQIPDLSGTYEVLDGTILRQADVDDTPVNGVTTAPVSSNWAYDHENGSDPHPVYKLESEMGSIVSANQATHQNDSAASDVAGIVADFNTLLGFLQSAGIMA